MPAVTWPSSWTATGGGRRSAALNRLRGHKAGIEAVRETIRCASDLGVRYLTIYSFSTENWKRPRGRGGGPHGPVRQDHAGRGGRAARGERARGTTIGDLSVAARRRRARRSRKPGRRRRATTGMTLGGGGELRRPGRRLLGAVRAYAGRSAILEAGRRSRPARRASPRSCSSAGCTRPACPIPTCSSARAAEMRMSNFLLWQIAYAEFVCTAGAVARLRPLRVFTLRCWNIRGATGASGV